ncbi:MAG: hypothetical protein II776_01300 [Clostridia bacterium]|nr:hypothetical protein [Clostridia bacterium]
MKKLFRAAAAILPHATLVASLLLLILFIIDRFNEAMAFLNNDLTKWILAVFCLLTLCLSVLTILRDEARRKQARRGSEGDEYERTK